MKMKSIIIQINYKKNVIYIEVTALRSRLQQMEMSRDAMEKELRDKVKKEFLDLVEDLVNVNTNLKAQLDHFK